MAEGHGALSDPRSAIASAVASLPPPHVISDLLSVGVCVRCIFRIFRVHGNVYTYSSITASMLWLVVEDSKVTNSNSNENGCFSHGSNSCLYVREETVSEKACCCICLGILQFTYNHEQEICRDLTEKNCIDDLVMMLAELVKREAHQIDGVCLEISIPPVILANERAIWLYMKKKYESSEWFRESSLMDNIPVKDVLKLSISSALEKHLAVKVGVSSFRIRLIYYHSKASMDLQNSLAKAQGSKRRKTELISRVDVEVLNEGIRNECNHNEQAKNESDAVTRRILSSLPDDVFCEHFLLPPEKVKEPCSLRTMCYRMPIYIGGRYLKFSRKVSQSRWIIDDERMGETSVEEIIGSNVLLVCKGDSYKFHAAGREDIDVRMLGSGRPFLVEVSNARSMLSSADTQEIAEKINGSEHKYVKVRDLRVIGSEAWTLMREGEAEKQKQYAALVWISRPLTEEDQQKLTSTKDMEYVGHRGLIPGPNF